MTKLTTERLEYYAALPTKPAEGDGFFKKGIFMYEVRRMARQLLAYEQAAKTATAITTDEEMFHVTHGSNGQIFAECRSDDFERKGLRVIKLYAAPVLPKQPELLSIGELLQRLEEQTSEKWVRESEQPVASLTS